MNDSCLGSKSPSHYFPVLGNLLAVLLIKFPTTNQILTEFCFISIIRNFECIINDDSYHSIPFWLVSTFFLCSWSPTRLKRHWRQEELRAVDLLVGRDVHQTGKPKCKLTTFMKWSMITGNVSMLYSLSMWNTHNPQNPIFVE